jgi:hypothetical protein
VKIALACQSVLLEKSLEIFLKSYISPYKQCDFVISDREIEIDKPLFYIATENADLIMPFSKSSLMLKIESFHGLLFEKEVEEKIEKVDIDKLEEKIVKLTDSFRDDLIKTIKEHYDK